MVWLFFLLHAHLYSRKYGKKVTIKIISSYRGLRNGSKSVQNSYLEQYLYLCKVCGYLVLVFVDWGFFPLKQLSWLYLFLFSSDLRESFCCQPFISFLSGKKFLSFAEDIPCQKNLFSLPPLLYLPA